MMDKIEKVLTAVEAGINEMPTSNALLVGISGIDGSGKGYVTERMAEALGRRGLRCATVNADGWLNLPDVRFSSDDQARHFYNNALRLDEMFERLILPLRTHRSIAISADLAEETSVTFRPHIYRYSNIDVILLEGIFLFKRSYISNFDLAVWIECSFETALSRAIARCQEGLPPLETARAYETIYFPAQRIHLATDGPEHSADFVIVNS